MSKAWKTLTRLPTDEGLLELRQRGEQEFLIVIGGRILMTSVARRSEEALATLACKHLDRAKSPRVLVGGLGMGYTLRALLDRLSDKSKVVVAELNPVVAEWCRGPLAPLTAGAVRDARVKIELGDVAEIISQAKAGSYNAILLDLYEGPHAATQRHEDPFYGPTALARTHKALAKKGVFAVWAEEPDNRFATRLKAAGFDTSTHRSGKGGRSHVIYLGIRT